MELISPTCWDASNIYPHVHNITTLYPGGILSTDQNDLLEFWGCWEAQFPVNYNRTFGLGYYKFTAIVDGVEKDSFYFDYRTSAVPEDYNSGGGGDLQIDFDVSEEKIFYTGTQIEFPTYSAIWEERPWISAETYELEDFWDHSLFVFPSVERHPYIVWGPYPTTEHMQQFIFQIWRKYGRLDWNIIENVNSSVFNYEDESLSITGIGPGTTVQYKVRIVESALPNNPLSDYSNIGSIIVDGYDPGKKVSGKMNEVVGFKLYPNYPNPFNPTTIIKYSIANLELVQLKVFDMLGREIQTLVNEYKQAGTYYVKFYASNLSSGIYFYSIKAGNYTVTRKLLIEK